MGYVFLCYTCVVYIRNPKMVLNVTNTLLIHSLVRYATTHPIISFISENLSKHISKQLEISLYYSKESIEWMQMRNIHNTHSPFNSQAIQKDTGNAIAVWSCHVPNFNENHTSISLNFLLFNPPSSLLPSYMI